MNKEQYEEKKRLIPNFDEEYVTWLPLDKLDYDKEKSQFRVAGHKVDKVSKYAEKIKEDPNWSNMPPVTPKRKPNGTHEPKDGMTRILGAAAAGQNKIKIQTWTDSQGFSEEEWSDFQARANDHPQASPNTEEDIKHHINRQVQEGHLANKLGVTLEPDNSNAEEYIDEGAEHYKGLFKNSGKNIRWFKNVIKKALGGRTSEAFENYTKLGSGVGSAVGFYAEKTGWKGTKVGEVADGRTVYIDNGKCFSPQALGNAVTQLVKNKDVEVDLVFYVSSLAPATNKRIVKAREELLKKVKDTNKRFSIFTRVYILPQMKRDSKRNEIEKDDMSKIILAFGPELS